MQRVKPIPSTTFSDRPGEAEWRIENYQFDTEEQKAREDEYRIAWPTAVVTPYPWGKVLAVVEQTAASYRNYATPDEHAFGGLKLPEQYAFFAEVAEAIEAVLERQRKSLHEATGHKYNKDR